MDVNTYQLRPRAIRLGNRDTGGGNPVSDHYLVIR